MQTKDIYDYAHRFTLEYAILYGIFSKTNYLPTYYAVNKFAIEFVLYEVFSILSMIAILSAYNNR